MSRAWRIAAVLCVTLGALTRPAAAGESRAAYGRYALRGPLEHFALDGGRAGRSIVDLDLGGGETLELELLVPVLAEPRPGFPGPAPPAGSLPTGAQVRFLDWEGPRNLRMREGWRRVPRGLAARGRPPVEERRPGPGAFVLAVLVAAGLLGLGLRRRPLPALLVGGAAMAVLLLRGVPPLEPSGVVLLEGSAGQDWIRVHGRRAAVTLDPVEGAGEVVRIETAPADAPLVIHVDAGRGGGGERLSADATLFVLRPLVSEDSASALEPRTVVRDRWELVDPSYHHRVAIERGYRAGLPGVWYRTPNGQWSSWREARLQGAPPGWLASALPQGVGVLLFQGRGGRFLRQTGLIARPPWFVE